MTLAFSNPGSLLINVVGIRRNAQPSRLLACSKSDRSTKAVVVFHHHRDVKVALDELSLAGFSQDCLTLMSRRTQKYRGHSYLTADGNFDMEKLNFEGVEREFLRRLFQRGKHLVIITGSHSDIKAASKIVSRRRNRTQIWHC